MRIDLYPEKAQYLTNEIIKLMIEFDTPPTTEYQADLYITHLQDMIHKQRVSLTDQLCEIQLPGINTDFGGYGVELLVYQNGQLVDCCYTAFDVVSECSKAIRYGFLSDYSTDDGLDFRDVSNLRKFHINYVQYYDWSYRHDNLVSQKTIYNDMMGRKVDLQTVKNKIKQCKEYGMKSIGYGAIYAASREFYEKNKEWAFYTSTGDPFVFIDIFYIMNIAKNSPWRNHIIEEYAKAIEMVGFDGIHMDTYGFPKSAYSYNKEKLVKLEDEFYSLIEDAKERLNRITMDNHLIFNNVGNWPVNTVACAPQDAIYIEVWDPNNRYDHIQQIIKDARRECKDTKPVILAAYLKPFMEETQERSAYAAFFLTAVIVTNGGYHLLLGEENAVLTQGYYVDHSFMTASTSEKMRCYYDFIVQYMELFYDSELIDVSLTHMGWDNMEYKCLNEGWSVTGEEDRLWITLREKNNRKLISLINLSGNDNFWNQGKNKPPVTENLEMQVLVEKTVKGVYFISPDKDHGKVQELAYERKKTDRGWIITFVVPQIEIWSNVWIDLID
ncbi:MAG: hypothetical protein GX359_01620 [Clostridiales bacterium]|nr:hypothetical protein [Clostridiales bacterium]